MLRASSILSSQSSGPGTVTASLPSLTCKWSFYLRHPLCLANQRCLLFEMQVNGAADGMMDRRDRRGGWGGGVAEKVRVYGERFPVWFTDAGLIRSLEQMGFWKRYVVLFSIGPSLTKPIVWSHGKQSDAKGRVSWCTWENALKRSHLNIDKINTNSILKSTPQLSRDTKVFDSSNGDDPAGDSLPSGVMLIQGLCGLGNKKT